MLETLLLVGGIYFGFVFWCHYAASARHLCYLKDPRYKRSFSGEDLKKWGDRYETIFFAGNGDSFSQAAFYTGKEGLLGMKTVPSIRTLINPARAIDPFDVERSWLSYLLYPFYYPIYIYLHSWRPVWNLQPYYTNPFKINLAQEDDLKFAARKIEEIAATTEKDLILYGVSRGASVVISVPGYLTEATQKRVKLVVAEAPFDSVKGVLETRFRFLRSFMCLVLRLTRYRPDGISPVTLVPTLPKSIPIVIIASKKDDNVGYKSTMNLHRALKEHVDRVDLITLEKSSHAGYTGDDLEDTNRYYEELLKVYNKVL